MNRSGLAKLRRKHDALLRGSATEKREIEALAAALGRVRKKKQTGEPAWVSAVFGDLLPVRIPGHVTLNKFTARGILKSLAEDLDRWDEALPMEDAGDDHE